MTVCVLAKLTKNDTVSEGPAVADSALTTVEAGTAVGATTTAEVAGGEVVDNGG